ncbi:peptidoglycan-binding domain-containing protein [uncultured Tateyamaria sp.]|uniref:peptidoglycan-binding domain-containing protein n=1 Tax=uncultured Tateyamaria sp. TaxID=455651 RepID=UPI0026036D03|nr:peptidoglycan-binding domain-containing protein [uncultured Tateyamaria sp.]
MRRAGLRALWTLASVTLLAVAPAAAQDGVRIVGMVVSSGTDAQRAESALRSLNALNAEVLQVSAPSNAELRAMMRRFSQEAAQADAAVVFLDLPAVRFEERIFVLPGGARLNRSTDIFTEAVPLRAFARMTVLAERGGAVILSSEAPSDLPEGVEHADAASAPLVGSSEIVVVPAQEASGVLDVLSERTDGTPSVDLRAVLEDMSLVPGATLSAVPADPIVLRAPPVAARAPIDPVAVPVPEIIENTEADTPATEAELAILEQSLSPPVKRDLQRALRASGHYRGLIDGIIGVQTREAIKGFQVARSEADTGLLTPTQLLELLARK